MSPRQTILASLWSFWTRGRRIERIGYLVGLLLLTSGIVHLGILSLGGGSWEGPLSFRKPAVFGLSFGLTLITIVWTASFLPLAERTRVALLSIFTVACILETALVSLQAWRGVPSHFNVETAFDGHVARALAAGGFALVAVIVGLTVKAFRKSPSAPVSLRVALQIGFVVLCIAMAVGATMIARGMMLVFAGNPAAAYATGGALKPTHGVTMHAILVLPALAWLLSFADWSERRRLRTVLWASAGYVVLAGVVAAANIAGVELRQLPATVGALMGLAALSILTSVAIAVLGVARAPAARGIEHDEGRPLRV
jgi:hypothetical protein